MNIDHKKPENRPLYIFALIAVGVILFLNIFAIPAMQERSVEKTDYSTFLSNVERGNVSKAEVQDDYIYYVVRKNGEDVVCKTVRMDDPDLVSRLYEAGTSMEAVEPQKQSIFLSLVIGYVIPIVIFVFLGRWLSKKMMSSMGGGPGGAMSFGKSNAKVYVKSSTGIKFTDVAGEDEAKENLTEIVEYLHDPDKYKEIYRDVDVETVCNSPIIAPKGTKMGDFYRKSVLDYYACMTGVDEQVGRIIRQLKEQGLFDNTIVVFTSDHGDSMGMHEHIGKNIYYEEAMRIPMMISWPEKITPRRDSTLMIAFADLYPSLLSLMGFKDRIPAEVQTFDLSASILSPENTQEIVQPYYYLLPENLTTGYRGLRTKKYTFAVHATNGRTDEWILFDREQDPFQLNNIAPDQPALIKQFSNQLKDWLKKTNDPFMNCL